MASHEQPGRGFYEATSDRMGQFPLTPYTPKKLAFRGQSTNVPIEIVVRVPEQPDYLVKDPVRQEFIKVIERLTDEHYFLGKRLFDFGMGNAVEELKIGAQPSQIVGVDIIKRNLERAGAVMLSHPDINARFEKNTDYIKLWHGNAVDFVAQMPRGGLRGLGIANLPQVPLRGSRVKNAADNYLRLDQDAQLENKYGAHGLTLRAQFLLHARNAADPNFRLLMFFSEWYDPAVVERMLDETGWEITHTLGRPIVQQDRNTNIQWLANIAREVDGRFFADQQGRRHISFESALTRWQVVQGTTTHPELYHRLNIFELKPGVRPVITQVVDTRKTNSEAA